MAIGFCFSNLSLEICFSKRFRKPFNGITQHGAGHLPVMCLQEGLFRLLVPFPYLPKHPPHRLVDQILFVAQKHFGYLQRLREPILPDETEGGDDGDAAFLEIPGAGEAMKGGFVPG